ncbi:carboxypeptidase-like regulatory domain-containing protein [Chitinophaga sp. 30R24]|uniref:carboxypeptidase-like regulatory domain-containing protein n=1 Tax=Chitinophaga sp. 30R24 TaxID=3248838 RepID=UPI003B8F24ED
MKKYLALLWLFCFIGIPAFAQQRVITGIVSDSSNKPIQNAVVREKETGFSMATTDKTGHFSLKVATDNVTLEVNAAGYGHTNITVPAYQKKVQIMLSPLQQLVNKNDRRRYIMGNQKDTGRKQ